MDCKYKALVTNDTWEIIKLPPDKKTITYKWVFKIRLKYHNSLERNKRRVVTRRYLQIVCLNYTEIFSPVVKATIIQVVLI